jgi:hypothetical protein
MSNTYQITIEGLKDPQTFVLEWAKIYDYPNDEKYTNNIKNGLETDKALIELFEWKNGTGDSISEKKMTRIDEFISKRVEMLEMKSNFNINDFQNAIEPQKGSVIWKIFLLHIIHPEYYPIYDQHVYRSFKFFTTGEIKEIPKQDKEKYTSYRDDYVEWFHKIKTQHNLNPREMDKSFFVFGRTLKMLSSKPIKIYELGL